MGIDSAEESTVAFIKSIWPFPALFCLVIIEVPLVVDCSFTYLLLVLLGMKFVAVAN